MKFKAFKVNSQCRSVHNTCFQAPDTVFNLHVALDRYVQQVDDLHAEVTMEVKEVTM